VGNKEGIPEGYQVNLSDFALFQSVMKNRRAYQIVLSIILGEWNVELREVKTEEIVLNDRGKRAIRLDAWSLAADGRQFNVEMQNDTEHDDMRKRSRYYQGLIDAPVLKAGRKTKYRELPATVIIFITQEDIFGRGLVRYTFEESCLELPDLKLEDGTRKLFLNMSVKQGNALLVSLLQYMKKTTLDNPEIVTRENRLIELDEIVREVKMSEEWEDVGMSILSLGMERGEERKLISLVCRKLSKQKTPEEIAEALEEDQSEIDRICAAAMKYAPGYDVNAIYEELHKKTA